MFISVIGHECQIAVPDSEASLGLLNMMESEKKPESEDEDVHRVAEGSRRTLSHTVAGGPALAGRESLENSTSKRGFSESSDANSVTVEAAIQTTAFKRRKLSEAEPLKSEEQAAQGSEVSSDPATEGELLLGAAVQEPFLKACPGPPSTFSSCSSISAEAVPLRIDAEEKAAQDMDALASGREPLLPPEETSAACALGNGDPAFKCGECGHLFSSCADLEKHTDSHLSPTRGQACSHRGAQEESSSVALHIHVRQAQGPQEAFSCDLCGFQCVEENLLNTHYLGKTHLRRQNLVARGGFVQILTKSPFPKESCTLGAKHTQMKTRASKPVAKNSDLKGLHSALGGLKELPGDLPAPSSAGDMLPSSSVLLGKAGIAGEAVTPPGAAQNPESQSTNSGALATSEGFSNSLALPRNPVQIAQSLSSAPRPRHERMLMLGSSFRRRSGLKGQAKKRFGLLRISKRGSSETQRMYLKHLKTHLKASGTQTASPHPQVSGSFHTSDVTCAAAQAPKQDKRSPHLLCSLDSLTTGPASDHQVLCACTDCDQITTAGMELETHTKRCHAREIVFSCQACDFSCMSQRDLDEHLHNNQHQQTASLLRCHCCSFISVNEINLRDHMKQQHSMGFLCIPCNLFFLSEKEMEEHKSTEKHLHLSVSTKPSQPFEHELAIPSLPLGTLEPANTKDSLSESEKAAQEEPVKSRLSQGNEVRHASKPQFQCKKCFYKTRSSTVLTRHIKLRHGQDYHFLCKACNLYSLSKEGMEKHIKRSKHLENAKKNNIGLTFEECIERVWIGANDKKEELNTSGNGRLDGLGDPMPLQEQSCLEKISLTSKDLSQSGLVTKDETLVLNTAPKRGRPKGSLSRTCSHCGLLASSITNLTVHIRRKHSHQYSYLCKVCKYYTVTKGDMERHCATKKHKGRVEIETSGKQSSDIIIGPEVGHLEACRKSPNSDELANKAGGSGASLSEKAVTKQGNAIEVEVESVFHSLDGGHAGSGAVDKRGQMSLEPDNHLEQEEVCCQRDVVGPGDNKCGHCDFNTHSCASLELHIKRKHTKEFAFYCMACDYYAVTRREMMRHAATEKHKLKRQAYLNSSGAEASSGELSSDGLLPEEQHQQPCEEFRAISQQQPETLHSGSPVDPCVLEEDAHLHLPKDLCASRSADTVTLGESNLCDDRPLYEALQEPPVKDKVLGSEEMVSLQISTDLSFSSKAQYENSGGSALNDKKAERGHPETDVTDGLTVHCEGGGGSLRDSRDAAIRDHISSGVLTGEHSAENTTPAMMGTAAEELEPDSEGQNKDGGAEPSGDWTCAQEDPVLENKILVNSQQESKIILEEDGTASDSRVESSGVYETIISIDEKGQTVYGFGQFDSSIIRIKNPEDGELMEQPEEGLLQAGVRISELPLKDSAQGLKKKKLEGSSFSESTRIRCDDCGFLADGLSGLNVHIAMKHPTKEKHFHCLLCGKSFYTESNLHQHLASAGHMRNEQASVEELPEGGATFKCVKCTEPFDSEQNLFLHIKGQHEELLREVNKYIVEDTEQINREREENQGNVCKFCGKMCRSSNSMAFLAHIRTHTGMSSQPRNKERGSRGLGSFPLGGPHCPAS